MKIIGVLVCTWKRAFHDVVVCVAEKGKTTVMILLATVNVGFPFLSLPSQCENWMKNQPCDHFKLHALINSLEIIIYSKHMESRSWKEFFEVLQRLLKPQAALFHSHSVYRMNWKLIFTHKVLNLKKTKVFKDTNNFLTIQLSYWMVSGSFSITYGFMLRIIAS